MRSNSYDAWAKAGWSTWNLGIESVAVMGLRAMKMAQADDGALMEARLMIAEKVEAAIELQLKLWTDPLNATPLRQTKRALQLYAPKVTDNRRRLATRE